MNAVVVKLFDQARSAADQADRAQRRGELLGPLHGVPITIKESFHLAGTPSSMGVATRQQMLTQDARLVGRLKRAGAIVLGKTNVPQLMVWHESDNPVYGRTNNPWDLNRTPGGSTGGEAAIIAARGSPLGLGGDLGGSIRIPCHFCGIHGLKPTSVRLTRTGTAGSLRGMEAIKYQPGPLARRVEDLELALSVLADSTGDLEPPEVPPLRLPDPKLVDVTSLRVALVADDPYFPAAPGIRRASVEAAAALRKHGVTVETWSPPSMVAAMKIYFGLLGADGGADAQRILRGSPIDWRLLRLLRIAGLPRFVRWPLISLLKLSGQTWQAHMLSAARAVSADRYWQLTEQMQDYINEYMSSLVAGSFDAVLTPPHALPAMPHLTAIDLLPAACYSFLPNLLGAPTGVVSITRVRTDEESDRPSSRDHVVRQAKIVESGSAGLPIGVQITARHWREDVLLALMATVERAFQACDDFPPAATPSDTA